MRLLVLSVSMKDQTQKDRMVKSNRLKVNYQYLCLIWPLVALVVIVSAECVYGIINSNNETLNACVAQWFPIFIVVEIHSMNRKTTAAKGSLMKWASTNRRTESSAEQNIFSLETFWWKAEVGLCLLNSISSRVIFKLGLVSCWRKYQSRVQYWHLY